MGFSGEYKRISNNRLGALLEDPDLVLGELHPETEVDGAGVWLSIEKSFDGLNHLLGRLITDRSIPFIDAIPSLAPLDGTETGAVLDYGPVCYRTPDEVAKTAGVLAGVSREQLLSVYDPRLMMQKRIYPETWNQGESEFDYLWQRFNDVSAFYSDAARSGEAILLWIA